MRILPARQHRRMPWKNGGGETTEIIAAPEGAGLDAFDWRVSMARVAADGPFSAFPGIDRTLSVLAGEGMTLAIAGQAEVTLTIASAPLPFPADAATTARLVNGPITDLNVMTRRGRWRHLVTRHVVEGALSLRCEADRTLILSRGEAINLARGEARASLGLDDAILVEGPAEIVLGCGAPAMLFLVKLREEQSEAAGS